MSKKNDNIVTALNELVGVMSVENLIAHTGKGKKKQVDDETTLENIKGNLAYVKGVIDGAEVSNSEIDLFYFKNRFNDFYGEAVGMYPDEVEAFSDSALVYPYDEDEADEADEDEVDLESMSLKELKALAKENGIKVNPKIDKDTLIEELSEVLYGDDEDADTDEDDDEADEADEDADDEADEDDIDLESMSLGELRKLAKQNSIKYTPKTKKEELIEWLEEALADESDEDADEDEDEIDLESMSLKELKAFAKENGIKVTPKMKKDDIIEAIEELMADEADEDADDEADTDEDDDDISEEELDEVLDEEFEDETIAEEEEKAVVKKGKKLPPKRNKR